MNLLFGCKFVSRNFNPKETASWIVIHNFSREPRLNKRVCPYVRWLVGPFFVCGQRPKDAQLMS